MSLFKGDGEKDQHLAEELGFTDKAERRVEDKGKPKPPEKADNVCVVEGCSEVKAPGQTHVCTKHVRTN